jgi:CRISPR-associated exonuclease Cas4
MLGYLYYAQSHQRQPVEISAALRQQTLEAIEAVTRLLETGAMPIAVYFPRCKGCSLYSQCLPKAAAKVARYQEVE